MCCCILWQMHSKSLEESAVQRVGSMLPPNHEKWDNFWMFILPTETSVSIHASMNASSCFYMFVCKHIHKSESVVSPVFCYSICNCCLVCPPHTVRPRYVTTGTPTNVTSAWNQVTLAQCAWLFHSIVSGKDFCYNSILNVKWCCQWYPTECSDKYSKGYPR